MARKRFKHAHPQSIGFSVDAFCYENRFVFASCWVVTLYLTHMYWLFERFMYHDHKDLNSLKHPPKQPPPEIEQIRQEGTKSFIDTSMEDDDIHIVFSTGCNAFQDWQSYLMFHQIWRVGQTGHVTRIVSGCATPQLENTIRSIFHEQIQNGIPTGRDRFHLHFTPDYSNVIPGLTYPPLNKPFGILDWMESVLKMPKTLSQYADTMFVILDPDQIVVRPFKSRNFSQDFNASRWRIFDSETYFEFNATPHVLKEGSLFSQFFNLGVGWMENVHNDLKRVVDAAWNAMDGNPAFTDGMRKSSYLSKWTENDLWDHYQSGTPYIALGPDFYRIAKVWAAVAAPVYQLTANHISEMYAYSTAAAHLSLPHDLSYSFMISDTEVDWYEGWDMIDEMAPNDVCQNTWSDWSDPKNVEYRRQMPYVIHYSHEYAHGPYYFFKYLVPNDFLSCGHPLLVDPTEHDLNVTDPQQTLVLSYQGTSARTHYDFSSISEVARKRNAFMLCHLIPRINEAAIFWKLNHCAVGTANLHQVYKIAIS